MLFASELGPIDIKTSYGCTRYDTPDGQKDRHEERLRHEVPAASPVGTARPVCSKSD